MARIFIKDLQPGMTIDDQVFHLTTKDLRSSTNGSLYMSLTLADKTGPVNARMWQASEELYKALPQDGFVRVKGRTENYKGLLQFVVDAIRPIGTEEINVDDFLPTTDKDIDQMYKRVVEILRTIKDKNLLFIIKQFIDDKELMERFRKAPAAISMHHACIGGLLEHTLGTMELALVFAPRYPQINADLLLAGAFLHDIGKTKELAWDTSLKYTDSGQFLGHLVMGAMMIEQKSIQAQKDLGGPAPVKLVQLLQHLVISHHGSHEFGAAKLPMTTEALLLHHLDDMDAKINMIQGQFGSADSETEWKYIKSMERMFLNPKLAGPNEIA